MRHDPTKPLPLVIPELGLNETMCVPANELPVRLPETANDDQLVWCHGCAQWVPAGEYSCRRQSTAYHNDLLNFEESCLGCFEYHGELWAERWAEVNGDIRYGLHQAEEDRRHGLRKSHTITSAD